MNRLKKILLKNNHRLIEPVSADDFLTETANRFVSHQFLNNSIQLVIQRQIIYFKKVLVSYFNKPIKEIKVLDWGSGKGHIAYLLKKNDYNIASCDIKVDKGDSSFGQEIPIIEKMGHTVTPLTHEYRLPFEEGSFDCVFSFGVLEHVKNDLASMKEIRRVLQKNGVFVILYLPYALSWTQNLSHLKGNYYHDRLYSLKKIKRMSLLADFEVIEYKHAQLFPKNSVSVFFDQYLEKIDRFLCEYTPLKYFATNLEIVLKVKSN